MPLIFSRNPMASSPLMRTMGEGVKLALPADMARMSAYANGAGSLWPSSDMETSGTGRPQLNTPPTTSGT